MTEQEAVRYTLEGVELTAHKDENGCLLIARADKEPSYSSNLVVEIRPDLSVRRGMVPGTTRREWFKLFTRPGSGGPLSVSQIRWRKPWNKPKRNCWKRTAGK